MKRFIVLISILLIIGTGLAFAGGRQQEAGPAGTHNIVFWDMMWGPAQFYPAARQALVDRYNASNRDNIHVALQMVPWDNFYQVFLTAVTSRNAPDISTGAFMQTIQYAEMGEGLDLTPIVDAWRRENSPMINDYSSAILNLHTFEGRHYGIPWNLDTRQMITAPIISRVQASPGCLRPGPNCSKSALS